ncbi:MAG: hypothetical protein WBA35_08605, partial [Litorimonas sp.]
ALAVAKCNGTLRRNFQGYTADPCRTLIGLGPSSISQFAQGYAQNVKSARAYSRAVQDGALPTERGVPVSESDRATAGAIEQLMCEFHLDAPRLRAEHGPQADPVLAKAALIAHLDEDGLFEPCADGFRVTDLGRPFVRTLASRLDDYLTRRSDRFSAAV